MVEVSRLILPEMFVEIEADVLIIDQVELLRTVLSRFFILLKVIPGQ